MERLTKTETNEMICINEDCDTCEEYCPYCNLNAGNCKCLEDIVKKLAQYEDLGLEPEQLKEIDTLYLEKCEEVNRLKAESLTGLEMAQIYAILNHFKTLKEQNRLIELPCKVGDTVYATRMGEIKEYKVFAINIGLRANAKSCVILTKTIRGSIVDFELIDFGKIVFITREEAKAKLKEREVEE